MNESTSILSVHAALSRLANGIIPSDERDAGAASVKAGLRIAERLGARLETGIYGSGLKVAEAHAQSTFGKAVKELSPDEVHHLLTYLSEFSPAFFRQVRADVCSLYLSDPDVWQRIGFPGPSTAQGGYPDFDQRQ